MPFTRPSVSFCALLTITSALVLQGCGGGGDSPAAAAPVAPAAPKPLIAVQSEPAGSHCAQAGRAVLAGLDADRDGTLAPSEVSSTQYVCNLVTVAPGISGIGGKRLLVALAAEAPGLNCAAGGTKVSTGVDANGNAVLNPGEVTSSAYVCGGGSVGGTVLAVVAEPVGSHCTDGGSKVTAGLDTSGNGVLDAGEVTSTRYACDAAPSSGFTWASVSAPGTVMQGDMGYLATGGTLVTLTLPATAGVGEIIRVHGVGAGGWSIEQQAGQSILPALVARELNRNWRAVASSQDGSKLVAVTFGGGQIYTSADFGATWVPRESNRSWFSVASSADGLKLAAVVFGGQIYTSTDSGVTWTARETSRAWSDIASSSDGSQLVAAVYGDEIYTSADSGATWTARAGIDDWTGVASSANGQLLAATAYNGQIYTSVDAGASWTSRESNREWYTIESSSDGVKLVAAEQNGLLYTSTDAGVSWTPRENVRNWSGLASSADGTRLVASDMNGLLYTSLDSGVTWTPRQDGHTWNAVASSADGTRIVAVDYGGKIYTTTLSTTPGVTGSLSGAQDEAIELQYLGGDQFEVVRTMGNLVVN